MRVGKVAAVLSLAVLLRAQTSRGTVTGTVLDPTGGVISGAGVTLTLPFNGAEVTDTDDLTAAARDVGPQFAWLSHTFDHHRLWKLHRLRSIALLKLRSGNEDRYFSTNFFSAPSIALQFFSECLRAASVELFSCDNVTLVFPPTSASSIVTV